MGATARSSGRHHVIDHLLAWLDDPRADGGVHIATSEGGWRKKSYPALANDVLGVAALLHDLEVPAGSVVSLILSTPDEFIAAFFGCLVAGCTPSPIATPLSLSGRQESFLDHMGRVLSTARPAVVLTDEAHSGIVEEALARAAIDVSARSLTLDRDGHHLPRPALADLALLQFTSGSSGTPKGVRVTPDNLLANANGILRWLAWGSEDSIATWLPLYHDMGLIGTMITPVASGTDLWVMTPMQFLRAPERWIECFGRHHVTITTSPTFGYAYAARKLQDKHLVGMDFSSWRIAICGAERIDPVALAAFADVLRGHRFDPSIFVGAYGLAEGTLAVTGVGPGEGTSVVRFERTSTAVGAPVLAVERGVLGHHPSNGGAWLASCGTPLPETSVTIVDESGVPLPDGHVGEIAIRGPGLAQGYRMAGGDSRPFSRDGWPTGDAGFLLDGELYVIGRTGDSLKVRGKRVFAEDIEAQLANVPGLNPGTFAALLGSVGGVDVAAVLVEDRSSRSDAWLSDTVGVLLSLLSDGVSVAVLRGPRGALLRTSSGKPRRRDLWRRLVDGNADWELLWESGPSAEHALPRWREHRVPAGVAAG